MLRPLDRVIIRSESIQQIFKMYYNLMYNICMYLYRLGLNIDGHVLMLNKTTLWYDDYMNNLIYYGILSILKLWNMFIINKYNKILGNIILINEFI